MSYNHWASRNRFKIGDSVRFIYINDSVMEVTGQEYEECYSPYPIYFDNSGDTVVELNRSGSFYFISGVSTHCKKGQKMIIKVLSIPSNAPSQSPSQSPSREMGYWADGPGFYPKPDPSTHWEKRWAKRLPRSALPL